MYTWHFSNGQLTYDRNDEIKAGLSLACDGGSIKLCDYGFHSSWRLIDALRCAGGNYLSLCEVGGRIIEGDDKLVSSIRRHIAVGDIERTLHLFAIWCADDEFDAAWGAAWAAASAAAWDAARGAAWDAASDAVWDKQNVKLTEMVFELPEFAPYKDLYMAQ